MPILKLVRWGALALAAVLGAVLLVKTYFPASGPVIQIGQPFKLVAARGGTVDSETLKGHPYGVFFGFTHCPEVCPTTMYEMTKAYKSLGDEAKDLRLFFITIDPERDTAAFLENYLANFDPRIEGLIPPVDELPALAKSFRVIYEKVPTSDGSYTMNHTATVFLFDAKGNFHSTIAYGEAEENRIAKLKRLLAGE
jgi:protein SCO1/2